MLVVKQEFGESTGKFGFADTCRPQEDEGANRALGIAESGARTANRVGHALKGSILADHALAQALLHCDELFDLALEHLRDGNAGPLGDDAGDVFFVHFFFQHACGAGAVARLSIHLRI